MKVTIYGENKMPKLIEKYEDVDFDLVTIKEIHKRNGMKVTQVRIKRGKRDIVISDGVFDFITVQDEETGRYILKLEKNR